MLDLDQIAATLESTPRVLQALLGPLDHGVLSTRPDEGEWSPLEVVGHLIACDSAAFRDRIQGILDGGPSLAAFDAWEAINKRDFNAEPLAGLIRELSVERAASAAFVRSLRSENLLEAAHTSDGRQFLAGDFVHEWPFHDQDHLQQILAALKLTHLPHMSSTMRSALTG